MSINHNWTTSLSRDLLSKRPSLSSRADGSAVGLSAGPCCRHSYILARAGVYPFSAAHHLPCNVAYEPLSGPQHPVPRPSVLGRTIVAAGCVCWPAPFARASVGGLFETMLRYLSVEGMLSGICPLTGRCRLNSPAMLRPKMGVGLRMSFATVENEASTTQCGSSCDWCLGESEQRLGPKG